MAFLMFAFLFSPSSPSSSSLQVVVVSPELKKQGSRCNVPSGYAVLNEDNNIEWHVTMATNAELTLKLVYTVERPQQDDVQGLPK